MDVVCALIKWKEKLLLAQRPKGGAHGLCWEFPGGKVEHGETDEEALCRELNEELRISVSPDEFQSIGSVQTGSIHLHGFVLARKVNPLPIEHQALAWLTPKDISTMDLAPGDRVLLSKLQSISHRSD